MQNYVSSVNDWLKNYVKFQDDYASGIFSYGVTTYVSVWYIAKTP